MISEFCWSCLQGPGDIYRRMTSLTVATPPPYYQRHRYRGRGGASWMLPDINTQLWILVEGPHPSSSLLMTVIKSAKDSLLHLALSSRSYTLLLCLLWLSLEKGWYRNSICAWGVHFRHGSSRVEWASNLIRECMVSRTTDLTLLCQWASFGWLVSSGAYNSHKWFLKILPKTSVAPSFNLWARN